MPCTVVIVAVHMLPIVVHMLRLIYNFEMFKIMHYDNRSHYCLSAVSMLSLCILCCLNAFSKQSHCVSMVFWLLHCILTAFALLNNVISGGGILTQNISCTAFATLWQSCCDQYIARISSNTKKQLMCSCSAIATLV